MKHIEGQGRTQITLLPDCIEDYIGEDNPVRVIDAFVNGLDIVGMGVRRSAPNEIGRPPYDPRDILKLYIYGYFNKIRSSRKLMIECGRNIELFYLINRLTPDFRTIADFRKENARALKGLCLCISAYKIILSCLNKLLRISLLVLLNFTQYQPVQKLYVYLCLFQ